MVHPSLVNVSNATSMDISPMNAKVWWTIFKIGETLDVMLVVNLDMLLITTDQEKMRWTSNLIKGIMWNAMHAKNLVTLPSTIEVGILIGIDVEVWFQQLENASSCSLAQLAT